MRKLSVLFIFLISIVNLFAINDLSVRVPNNPVQKKGYMEDITLVVEPHGAYSEQSLYIFYKDLNQFPGNQNVEIIHRFELPTGAIINDLWLWMGDSVMQAIHMDTWRARQIYDSIVSMKKDPAFLTKKGNQYELHVYPLASGSYRKIKINYLVPVSFINGKTVTEIPIKFLKSNNHLTKPIHILFRSKGVNWGEPYIYESPGLSFAAMADTMGYNYRYLLANDVTPFESFKIAFDLGMTAGKFFKSSRLNGDNAFFELGIALKDIYSFDTNYVNKDFVFAFDLASDFSKNLENQAASIKGVLINAMKRGDRFRVFISGAGEIREITSGWRLNDSTAIDEIFTLFLISDFYTNIKNSFIKWKILFADSHANLGWTFPGIENLTTTNSYSSLTSSLRWFSQSDIALAYDHGNEVPLSISELNMVVDTLTKFFNLGGKFLTYFDVNRDDHDRLSKHYFPGIATVGKNSNTITLRRRENGNIGYRYPPDFERGGQYYFTYAADSAIKVEVIESIQNRPTLLSKKFSNGLYTVTGMWPFSDDGSIRKLLHPPFMGLNVSRTKPMLDTLLNFVKDIYNSDNFEKLLIVSNSDQFYDSLKAYQKANQYLAGFNVTKPDVVTINLLDGSIVEPPVTVIGLDSYFGSGSFLKAIADKFAGQHFERSLRDWDYIYNSISPTQLPRIDSLKLEVLADNGTAPVFEYRKLKSSPSNLYEPQFFAGRHDAGNNLEFTLKVKFGDSDSIKTRNFSFTVNNDTLKRDFTVPGILATEKINELLAYASYDTAQIVKLSLDNRVLSNYTSMLCLEPNDTIHFMKDPWDESSLTGLEDEEELPDSLMLDIYPNPFNSMSLIKISIPDESKVVVSIYDITGQLVKTVADEDGIKGIKKYNWNGTDNFNTTLASGVYLVHVKIKGIASGKTDYISKKVIYLR